MKQIPPGIGMWRQSLSSLDYVYLFLIYYSNARTPGSRLGWVGPGLKKFGHLFLQLIVVAAQHISKQVCMQIARATGLWDTSCAAREE